LATGANRSTTVDDLTARIAAAPPRATRMAKRLVRESASATLPAALEMGGHHGAKCL
jgi:enoyl-CoA hydratase/carnithine racemase